MEHNSKGTEITKAKKAFREIHNCKHCFFFEKPRRCPAMNVRPLEEISMPVVVEDNQKFSCPKDDIGNSPYGNAAGTCFGYCWKDILKEFAEKRKSKEDKKTSKKSSDNGKKNEGKRRRFGLMQKAKALLIHNLFRNRSQNKHSENQEMPSIVGNVAPWLGLLGIGLLLISAVLRA